jgi:hypothetical protein
MLRHLHFALGAAVMMAGMGCKSNGTTGDLGAGTFTYHCSGKSDLACDTEDPTGLGEHPIPSAIAVGSHFNMTYAGNSLGSDTARVTPASSLIVSGQDPSFEAASPGVVAMLAQQTDGAIVDMTFVHTLAPTALQFTPSSLSLAVGEQGTIQAALVANGLPLSGASDCAWSSINPTIVEITSDLDDDTVTVRGDAPGTATIHLVMGTMVQNITVVVGGG